MEKNPYEQRLHRVVDYINAHLDEEISLENLAAHAAFSPYHFHRLFTALMGEPVAAFVRRLRLEKAASFLLADPGRSITEIALSCGFGSSAVFARAFREHFGQSASVWRVEYSKNRKKLRNDGKESSFATTYALPCWVPRGNQTEKETSVEVIVEEMAAMRAAYVRRMGAYNESACAAWEALCRWAGPRGLLGPGHTWFSLSYDDPTVTAAEKLHYDACISIDEKTAIDDAVGVHEIAARRVARARYEGPAAGIAAAYLELYREWLPQSGFLPADQPPMDIYRPELGNAPERDHYVMDICIPVIPA